MPTIDVKVRLTGLRFLPPIAKGYVRTYEECRTCGRVYFRDYVPFSMSRPIMILHCGHGIGERWERVVKTLDDQAGMRAILAQHAKQI